MLELTPRLWREIDEEELRQYCAASGRWRERNQTAVMEEVRRNTPSGEGWYERRSRYARMLDRMWELEQERCKRLMKRRYEMFTADHERQYNERLVISSSEFDQQIAAEDDGCCPGRLLARLFGWKKEDACLCERIAHIVESMAPVAQAA